MDPFQRTEFDLNFRLFGVPVRVHPSFWIVSAIFGWPYLKLGFGFLLLWIFCQFLAVLVHELGHVLMGRVFRAPGEILLMFMGGLAIRPYPIDERWKRLLVVAAGPGVGLLFYGLLWLFEEYGLQHMPVDLQVNFYFRMAIAMLMFMNLFWSVMNLLPVFPLDGGLISRELFMGAMGQRGLYYSLGLSFLAAGIVAFYSFLKQAREDLWYPPFDPTFMAIMFALLAVQSFMAMRDFEREMRRWDQD